MAAFLLVRSNFIVLLYEQELLCVSAEFATFRLFYTTFRLISLKKLIFITCFWNVRPVTSYPLSLASCIVESVECLIKAVHALCLQLTSELCCNKIPGKTTGSLLWKEF